MKKIKYYLAIITLCIATLMITETLPLNLGTYTVQAKASTSTKRKAQKAYRKFLTQRKYRYFTLWDIDKDGLKEFPTLSFPSVTRSSLRNFLLPMEKRE